MAIFRLGIALIVVVVSAPVLAAGPHGTQFGQPLSDSGQILITDTVAQALADSGAGVVRVNFRLGPYTSDTAAWYAAYDVMVNRLRSRGIEVIGLLTNEAQREWDTSKWTENAYETTGGDGWNNYLSGWVSMFARAAAHWNGKIRYWELWNEPDCLAVIYPSNYGALLAHAYDAVHTAGVDVEIISGGVCGGWAPFGPTYISNTYDVSINHTGWFTQMKNKWGTYPLDHVGFHIYPNCGSGLDTNWLSNYFDSVHNAYAAYEGAGTQKKMFLTEIGWMTGGGCYVSEATQAANLTAAFTVANSKSYIRHVNWFFLQDAPTAGLYYGLFKSTGLNETDKKQAWSAFSTANTYEGRWFAGGTIDQPILDYYTARGHAAMGNPYDNGGSAWVHNWDYAPVQDFSGGTLGRMVVCDSADGAAYAVRGDFFQAILNGHTTLEMPLSDRFFTGAGDKQFFEGGYVVSDSTGLHTTLYPTKQAIDNADAGFTASANWSTVVLADAYGGTYRRRKGTTTNSDPATWAVSLPQPGCYDVYVRYPAITSATSAAVYEVVHSTGTAAVTVNQQARSGRWNRLGSYTFGSSATIRLSSQGSSSQWISADAVRIVGPVNGPDTTPPTPVVVTDDGVFTAFPNRLHATWQSVDMESGIDHYEYAAGTSPTDPGSGYVIPWTSNGTVTEVTKGVVLALGGTYYIYVKAFNRLGMVASGVSDGITVDTTAPTQPIVTDDGDYTGDPALLHCSWSSSDPQSGVVEYFYSIGTTPGGTDVASTRSAGGATQVWVTGLSLSSAKTYYFSVRAVNGAGQYSQYGYSDGIGCRSAMSVDTISQALAQPDWTVVLLRGKTVSGVFADRFYLQDPAGMRGVAVGRYAALAEGGVVDVTGAVRTISGERVIVPGAVTPVQQ